MKTFLLAAALVLLLPAAPGAQAPPCDAMLSVIRAQRDNAEATAAHLFARLQAAEAELAKLKPEPAK